MVTASASEPDRQLWSSSSATRDTFDFSRIAALLAYSISFSSIRQGLSPVYQIRGRTLLGGHRLSHPIAILAASDSSGLSVMRMRAFRIPTKISFISRPSDASQRQRDLSLVSGTLSPDQKIESGSLFGRKARSRPTYKRDLRGTQFQEIDIPLLGLVSFSGIEF
jgi:hypothetical protein